MEYRILHFGKKEDRTDLFCPLWGLIQSRISISLPQQEGMTSPALIWTVLLQVTQ